MSDKYLLISVPSVSNFALHFLCNNQSNVRKALLHKSNMYIFEPFLYEHIKIINCPCLAYCLKLANQYMCSLLHTYLVAKPLLWLPGSFFFCINSHNNLAKTLLLLCVFCDLCPQTYLLYIFKSLEKQIKTYLCYNYENCLHK